MCPLQFLQIYCSYCNIFCDYYLTIVLIAIVDTRLPEYIVKVYIHYKRVNSHKKNFKSAIF